MGISNLELLQVHTYTTLGRIQLVVLNLGCELVHRQHHAAVDSESMLVRLLRSLLLAYQTPRPSSWGFTRCDPDLSTYKTGQSLSSIPGEYFLMTNPTLYNVHCANVLMY